MQKWGLARDLMEDRFVFLEKPDEYGFFGPLSETLWPTRFTVPTVTKWLTRFTVSMMKRTRVVVRPR